MKLRLLINLVSISLFAFALNRASAQSADDIFHSGARSYLSNNIPGAREEVDKGLKLFPDDIKLKKLDELLKQQQQQQQQQQQNQQQKNQSQQNQSQSKQDQQKQSQEQKQKEQQQKEQQQNQEKQQQKQGEDQQKEQQLEAAQMSREQAKQLMDQQKADEMLLPNSRKEKPHDQDHPVKDW
jgi:outer membrane biosynthesis protein TonB